MEENVVLNVGAKTKELAIRKTAYALVNQAGRVLFVQTDVRLGHGVETVVKHVNVTMEHPVIISLENVNVCLVL